MNQVLYAFLLTTLASFSTMIGSVFIFCSKLNKNKLLVSSLSFASSVMLMISIIDLIPEANKILFNNFNFIPALAIILIMINIGFIISSLIDKCIPSDDNIYKVGLISMVAIIIHNIPEGMATFIASSTDLKLGLSMSLAIALHNIPEGISISIPIYYSKKSRGIALKYTFISGISELFGAIITYLLLKPFINKIILGFLFSIIAGIMIYISIFELLNLSLKLNNRKRTIIFYILGIVIVFISHLFFSI